MCRSRLINRSNPRAGHSNRCVTAVCSVLLLISVFVFGASGEVPLTSVSDPAGIVRISVPSNESALVSMPFHPPDGDIAALLANQLIGGADESTGDSILKWDPAGQAYVMFFKADGTGDPEKDGKWFEAGTNWVLATETIDAAEGFWVVNRHNEQQVYLSGSVVLSDTQAVFLAEGLSLFGSPYSTAFDPNATELAQDGALGGTNETEADRILDADTNSWWLVDQDGHAHDGEWIGADGEPAGKILAPGQGFWFDRNGTGSLAWTEGRPYADLFAGATNAPTITAIVANPAQTSVTLFVSTSGEVGETIEVLYKDLDASSDLETSDGWLVADQNLGTSGGSTISWADRGSATRPAVSGVFCRIYLVSRQDIDADGDTLSDGREFLVHGTSAQSSDTDGDGLGDGTEVNVHLTDPTDSDTDGDAMGDGSEVYWGASPTNDDEYATLPWSEDFESLNEGDVDGQNGWVASPADTVLVQTNGIAGGTQALEFVPADVVGSAAHWIGSSGETNIWVDVWTVPVAGVLPDVGAATNRPSALLAVNPQGMLCAYDGISQRWIIATNGPSVSGQWMRLTIGLDYGSHTWRLNEGGRLLASNLGFKDNTVNEFTRVQWQGSTRSSTYLDDMAVSATEPADLDDDADGIPNIWERLHGLDPEDSSDALADTDQDGLVNAAEYQVGTNPLSNDTDGDGVMDGMEVAWSQDPMASNQYSFLPWAAGFEVGEGYATGDLDGQVQWSIDAGSSIVQTETVAAGGQAALIGAGSNATDSASAQHLFAGGDIDVTWSDMQVQMLPGTLPALTGGVSSLTAIFTVNPDGYLAGYDGSIQGWVVATNSPTIQRGAWLHLTVRNDYSNRTWTLYRSGMPVLQSLGFADESVGRFARIAVEGSESAGSHLDDVSLGSDVPAHIDDDADGIPNAQEDANGNGVVDAGETDPFNADSDNDGMDDGREIATGRNPTSPDAYAQIPWAAGFEAEEGYVGGSLNEQQGWAATGSANVQYSEFHAGTAAAEVYCSTDDSSSMAHDFGGYGEGIVWLEMFTKLKAGVLPEPESLVGSNSVLISVDPKGDLLAYDSLQAAWIPASEPISAPDEWSRLVFKVNYGTKEWDLYIGSRRALFGIPFLDESVRWLSQFQCILDAGASAGAGTLLDSLSFTSEEPVDLDNDGDGLFNAWEIQFGLDPESPDDVQGDLDDDGVSNYEEYLQGTDPTNSDTDSDGMSDGFELHQAGSDPLSADFDGTFINVLTIRGADAITNVGSWQIAGDAIENNGYGGSVTYLANIAAAGHYALEVDVSQIGHTNLTTDRLDVGLLCDGIDVGRQVMIASVATNGTVRWVLPYLSSGAHEMAFDWRFLWKNRKVRVNELRLQTLGGPDNNQNGLADWIDHRRAGMVVVDVPSGASLVSPACLEGSCLLFDSLTATSSVGGVVQVRHGVANNWYVNVPLSSAQQTIVTFDGNQGDTVLTNVIAWSVLNILDPTVTELSIRGGDALLLNAFPPGTTNGVVTISISGVTSITTSVDAPVAHTFEHSGTFLVNGIWTGENTATGQISVRVISADFSGTPVAWIDHPRVWKCPDLPPDIPVEFDARVAVTRIPLASTGTQFSIQVDDRADRFVVVRVTEGGPILASACLRGMDLFSSGQILLRVTDEYPDGSRRVESGVLEVPMQEDVRVELIAHTSGVLFDDGTILRELVASDFDETGFALVGFILNPDWDGGSCHRLRVYQGDDLVGER